MHNFGEHVVNNIVEMSSILVNQCVDFVDIFVNRLVDFVQEYVNNFVDCVCTFVGYVNTFLNDQEALPNRTIPRKTYFSAS